MAPQKNRYRAENEYINLPLATRMVATITALYNIALIFDFCDKDRAMFDFGKILDGELWRLGTSFMWYGFTANIAGSFIRYIFAMVGFIKYFYHLEAHYFRARKMHFFTVIFVYYLATCILAIILDKPLFLGDVLRVAILTMWSDIYYLDTFSCVGGMDLSRFRAKFLPIVWISVFAFLDYPISMTTHTSVHFQLFGFFLGKMYGVLESRMNWAPQEWKDRRSGDLHEFIPGIEMFVYLIFAVINKGSFM